MKRIHILLIATLSALWACDIKPAEEVIANTGAANFTASFEMPFDIPALWESGDKLVVVDSKNALHRFGLDAGADKASAEFSGTVSENSQVKYVLFAHDASGIQYEPSGELFTFNVPSIYTAKSADALVTANQAAIGKLQGSEVALQSVCGFVKFTLEPNGNTLEQGGKTYNLTDLKQVTFTDNDGKFFAGTLHARWPEGSAAPEFIDVEEGASTITFRTRVLTTSEGDIFYEAGDYYIPVAPQNYEDVTIKVEDTDGNIATAVAHRAIDVQTAMQSNLNSVSWPTVIIEVDYNAQTGAESASHTVIHAFPTGNLSVDRVNIQTGAKVDGQSPKKTEIAFTEGGLDYSMWTTNGVGKQTIGRDGIWQDVNFNAYNANWSYGGETWVAGTQHEYAWIKFPAYDGVLTRIEINLYSYSQGPISISTEVDSETGIGNADVYYAATTTRAFHWEDIRVSNGKRGSHYYFCMGEGYMYRVRGWRLHYKVFE